MPFHVGEEITPKHLGFLHVHCGIPVADIVNRYPSRLNLHLAYLGLSHYFKDREKLDAELKAESKFNVGASLKESSVGLPRVGLASLVASEEAFEAVAEADRKRIEKENWKPTLRIGEPPKEPSPEPSPPGETEKARKWSAISIWREFKGDGSARTRPGR